MAEQRYALELYSVRKDLAEDMLGTLQKVADMGYVAVEFAGGFVAPAEEVAAALKKTGLVCCGWHTPYSAVQDDTIDATIAYNQTVGNKYIIVPGLPRENSDSLAAWSASAKKISEIAAKLAPLGMYIGYHNHAAEFLPMEGSTAWATFFGEADPRVVMQLDNGNAMSSGVCDVLEVLRTYPGRAKTVHIKPYSNTKGFATMVGEDDVPHKEFVSLCRALHNTEWFVVEYECEELYTPLEGVKKCIDALHAMKL